MSRLTQQLNKYGFEVNCTENGPKLELSQVPEGCLDEEGLVVDPDLNTLLDDLDEAKVYYSDHPYGSQAGKVCYVKLRGELSWHDEHSECRWAD